MKINGWDISEAGARQLNVTPAFHSISNDSEWDNGSPIPQFFKNRIGFKPIKVTVLIKEDGGRRAILKRCSQIMSRLLEPARLELDNFEHEFYGILSKSSHSERVMDRWHTLTLEINCYEYGQEETHQANGETDFIITNPGNIETPLILEITPQIGTEEIRISGICRDQETGEDLPVVIRELVTGKKVTLNGEDGLITQDGELKAGDVDIWELPALLPGENRILIDSSRMDVTARFRPRFM